MNITIVTAHPAYPAFQVGQTYEVDSDTAMKLAAYSRPSATQEATLRVPGSSTIAKSRLLGYSGHDGADTDTFHLTVSAPASFDAVQITLLNDVNSANQYKASVAVSAALGNGWQPKDASGSNVSFTPLTFGTTDTANFRNPGGGAATAVINNQSGHIEGSAPSDWLAISSLARTDFPDRGPLLMIRTFGVGQGAIAYDLAASSSHNPIKSAVPDHFSGYWANTDYTLNTPPNGPEQETWFPALEVRFLLRGKAVVTIGCASESIEQGYHGGGAVPQFGGGVNGWPRRAVAALSASGITASYVDMNWSGSGSGQFHEKALSSVYAGGLTHLLFKPWTVNDLNDGVPGANAAIARTSVLISACLQSSVRPILIWPFGGPGRGSAARNLIDAFIADMKARGVSVFDPREVMEDASGQIKTQYLTRDSAGSIVDVEHLNELGHNTVAGLFLASKSSFGL
jgi:hypothetical protein